MRRSTLAALCVMALLPSTAVASPPLTLDHLSGATFPDRAFVLTLPDSRDLRAGAVQIVENGRPVQVVALAPANGVAAQRFGTVLVLDHSSSMNGAPIAGALAAAKTFAARRQPGQQLAIVTFNDRSSVALPFTSDAAAIDRALALTPKLGPGTHLYDGVRAGLELMARSHIDAGAVVLLSDGTDTGSRTSEAQLAAMARARNIRLYTVGLRSRSYDRDALEALAGKAGGTYAEAGAPSALAGIFADLGGRLANQYIVRYRSTEAAGAHVRVEARVAGFGEPAVATYVAPALQLPAAGVYHPGAERVWQSPAIAGLIALVTALMTWFIVVQLLRPRRRSLVHRMSDFVTMPSETQSKPTPGRPPTAAAGERLGRLDQFRQDLGIANISVSAERLIMGSLLGAGLLGLVTATATGIPLLILVGVIVPVVMRMVISRRLAARRRAFEEQLPDNLQVLASAMRAGHSLAGALAVVVEDAPEPARSEFRRVIADEQLGVSLEDSLGVVVRRMQSDDLDQVALLAALQHETGGNTAEVLERVTQTIRQRDDVRRMVRGLTAQGRISRWVVSALPVVLLAVIGVVNPGYLTPLFTKTAGQVMLAAGVAMVVTGSLAIKRIVDIKV